MSYARKPILLLDGGLGTALQASPYNEVFDTTTPTWSSHLLITRPQTLRDAQSDFARAGADVLLTATYQASFEGFASTASIASRQQLNGGQKGADLQRTEEYMRNAVSIAREAASKGSRERRAAPQPNDPQIALSMGPYGAILVPSQEYSGLYPAEMSSREALRKWHAQRLAVYTADQPTWSAVDFVAWETMKSTTEVLAVRDVMATISKTTLTPADQSHNKHEKRWWISTVWPDEPDQREVEAMVVAMLANEPFGMGKGIPGDNRRRGESVTISRAMPAPWAIGINCTAMEKLGTLVGYMEQSIERLEAEGEWATEWPWLVLYPNGSSDLKYDSKTMEWVPSGIQKDARSWDEALWQIVQNVRRGRWGGILVGGCCMTSAREIANLREHIDRDSEADR